jgi:hypothetical protein
MPKKKVLLGELPWNRKLSGKSAIHNWSQNGVGLSKKGLGLIQAVNHFAQLPCYRYEFIF